MNKLMIKPGLLCFIIFILIHSIQGQPVNQAKGSQTLLGSYKGYQDAYSMGVIAGKNILVPGITHTFKFINGGVVALNQVGDNGMIVNYRGKIISNKIINGNRVITCNLLENPAGKYPSNPTYQLTFYPDGNIECEENPGSKRKSPIFNLEKI